MAAQKGKDLLIRVETTKNSRQFKTLAGLRASRISFNSQTIDITNISSANGWRELLNGGGVRSASVSGSGVFLDADTDARARSIFFDAEIAKFEIIIPDFATIKGAFQITSLEYAGAV